MRTTILLTSSNQFLFDKGVIFCLEFPTTTTSPSFSIIFLIAFPTVSLFLTFGSTHGIAPSILFLILGLTWNHIFKEEIPCHGLEDGQQSGP